jgi:hypothetical protein
MHVFPVVPEDCCLSLVEYPYPPLEVGQNYVAPAEGNSGDLNCDCNTVMYKYEVRTP